MTRRKPPWEIFEEQSFERKKVGEVPAKVHPSTIEQLLVRLVCRNLTVDEVIAASQNPARNPSPFFRPSQNTAVDGRIRIEVGLATGTTFAAEKKG